MAVPTLTNTWRITYAGHVGTPAYPWETVVHVTCNWLADPQTVANEAGAAWVTTGGIRSIQSSNCTYDLITVQAYDGISAPLPCNVSGYTGVVGSAAGVAVPAQVAVLVTKKSLAAGRRNRGRMYLPAVLDTNTQSDGAQWSSAALTVFGPAVNAWKTKLEGGPNITNLVIYSHKYNSKIACSSLQVRQYFGTQRRRSEQ